MSIVQTRLAYDVNADQKIDAATELTESVEALRLHDDSRNGLIEGDELQQLYHEYAEDVWFPADKDYREIRDDLEMIVHINKIYVETRTLDVTVTFRAL